MAVRAMWKARVVFGDVDVPVRMYAAVEDTKVHFRLLAPKDDAPVRQRMVDPETGKEVAREEIRRGFEAKPGVFVVLDPEELDALEPEASREIELTHFVPAEALDHRWYDRPYYLGPDGDDEAYFALARALREEGREGIARWTMRRTSYVGALRWERDWLLMMTLRHPEQMVDAGALPQPDAPKPSAAERKMAEQLVATLEDEFEPGRYHDEYRERLLELIRAKAKGEVIELKKAAAKGGDGELDELLRRSVAAAKEARDAA